MVASTPGRNRIRAALPADWLAGDRPGTSVEAQTNDYAIVRPPGRAPPLVAAYREAPGLDMPHRGAVRLEARGERAWKTRRHRPQSDDCVRFERFREMVSERAHACAHIASRRIDDREAGFRSRFAACFHFDQRVSRDVVLAQMRRQRGLARAAQRELPEQCEAVRPCGTTVSFARWRRCRCRTHSTPWGACARNTARRSSGFKAFRRASGARSRGPLRRRYRAPCVRGAPRCRAAHACADARAR